MEVKLLEFVSLAAAPKRASGRDIGLDRMSRVCDLEDLWLPVEGKPVNAGGNDILQVDRRLLESRAANLECRVQFGPFLRAPVAEIFPVWNGFGVRGLRAKRAA